MNVTPTFGVSRPSSQILVSIAPTPVMIDESVLRLAPVAQRQKAEGHELSTVVGSVVGPSPPDLDVWSDFILPEHLFTSEDFRSCDFQDFSSPLFPNIPVPEIPGSTSPNIQPLLLCASENIASLNYVDAIGSPQFGIVDTIYLETGSTDSDPSGKPSNG